MGKTSLSKINGSRSKAITANPKDLLGSKKVSLSSVPPIAIAYEAAAFMDGALKYGPYNWRSRKVVARIYVDAAKRHIDEWFEGLEHASDTHTHHLGNARACLGILIDAMVTGNLIDDRPKVRRSGAKYLAEMKKLEEWVVERKKLAV